MRRQNPTLYWLGFGAAIATAILLAALTPQHALASASASDNANNDNMGNGINGGTGFAAWSNPQTGGGGGVFTGSSTANANHTSPGIDTSSKSWGMYCSGATVGANYSRMTRQFTAGTTPSAVLQPNQTFTIDMDNGFITTSGIVGFSLQNSSGNDVFSFKFVGGGSSYEINGANPSTSIAYTKSGLRVKVTLTSSTAYSVSAFDPNTSGTVIGPNTGSLMNLTGGQSIDRVILYTDGTGSGGDYDMFFNSMSITCPSFTITMEPTSTTVCSGSTATFTVASTSASAPTYQWQISTDNGSTWNAVTGGSGATTASYSTNALAAATGNQFRCVVTDACGTSVNSSAATLTVNTAVSIGTQPTDQTVCSGSTATFSLSATGTGLTYQWRKNGSPISNGATGNGSTYGGATTATLTITGAVAGDAASAGAGFDCVVSGTPPCSPVTSTRVALTVTATIVVNTQPTAQTACSTPGTASYTIAVTAANPTYQWRLNGTALSNGTQANGSTVAGATTATLSLSTLTSANTVTAGSGYDCVVSSTCGSPATSSRVALAVSTVPAISSQPTAQTACSTPGTASYSITATGDGLAYQWRLNGVNLSNGAQGNGSTVAGATTATLSLSTLASANTVAAGSGYDCVVSGISPCAAATSSRVALTVNTVPTVTVNPTDQTVCSGSTVTYTITATGTGLTYQWRKNGVNLSNGATGNGSTYGGATSATLTITGAAAADTASSGAGFDCVVSGTAPCSAATSTRAALTVNTAASITTPPSATAVCSGATANLSVVAGGTLPSYQWRKRGAGWGSSGAWALTTGGGGFFRGTSDNNGAGGGTSANGIDTSGNAWGMYNNGGVVSEAKRDFAAMSVGQVFEVEMDNGYINTGGTVGFSLRNSSDANLMEFYFVGGGSSYTINGTSVSPTLSIPITYNGVRFTLTVTSSTTFSVTVQALNGGSTYGPYTGTFLTTGSISRFRAFDANGSNNAGSPNDLFFNSLKVGPSAANPIYDDNAAAYSGWSNGDNKGQGPLANGATGTGSTVFGATTSGLSIASAGSSDAASYDVVVYNSCGDATSTAAALTINAIPGQTITPAASSVCAGSTGNSASVPTTSGATYSWSISGGTITGGQTSSTVTYTAGTGSAVTLNCVVTSSAGCASAGGQNTSATVNAVPGAPSPAASYAVAPHLSLKIKISDLLATWTGTSLSLYSAGPSSDQGGTVSTNSTYIFYLPPTGTITSDSISYTVSGANSCTTTASIGITFVKQGGVAQSITYASGGTVTINFAGIPTYAYDVQRCSDANFSSGNVTTVLTTNAPSAGVFTVTDTPPGTSSYYRLMQH